MRSPTGSDVRTLGLRSMHARLRVAASDQAMLALLAAGATALLAMTALQRWATPSGDLDFAGVGLFAATTAAAAALIVQARAPRAWAGTTVLAGGMVLAVLGESMWVGAREVLSPRAASAAFAGTVIVLIVAHLAAFAMDFVEHVQQGRGHILSDVALVTAVAGGPVYLMVRPLGWGSSTNDAGLVLHVVVALAALLFAARGVHALWCPTRVHWGLFAATALLSVGAVVLSASADDVVARWPGIAEVAVGLAVLATATVLVAEPRVNTGTPRTPLALPWIRLALFSISVGVLLVLLAVDRLTSLRTIGTFRSGVLLVVVSAIVGVRILLDRAAMAQSAVVLERALVGRESAITTLQSTSATLVRSEERLRRLLEAAVDGIVELDADSRIVRANDAFCRMVQLRLHEVVGRTWRAVAGDAVGGGDSLAALPTSGEAVLLVDGAACYLDARSSSLPTDPPGTLLLIRDVTASRIADRTIRTLLQFLQDRDEDRSRLLQRTTSAIEAERNRVARDLHDGPIQGMAAVTLSLEATRLMLEGGEVDRARETLEHVTRELSVETEDLRRLMRDLRPPVLEERGLFAAVRELCGRMQREHDIKVRVVTVPGAHVPDDVQTLGYRVAQEALSNVSKHAGAKNVDVRIEASAGTLEVEVTDDGVGFEASQAREYLYRGKVGLASMRERTELGAGTFIIRSSPGAGTTIIATIPFDVLSSTPQLEGLGNALSPAAHAASPGGAGI